MFKRKKERDNCDKFGLRKGDMVFFNNNIFARSTELGYIIQNSVSTGSVKKGLAYSLLTEGGVAPRRINQQTNTTEYFDVNLLNLKKTKKNNN
ncbi:MAG: hypothetical protein ACJAX4_000006 [Clostridium sp.]|jgi:hypothetical protein